MDKHALAFLLAHRQRTLSELEQLGRGVIDVAVLHAIVRGEGETSAGRRIRDHRSEPRSERTTDERDDELDVLTVDQIPAFGRLLEEARLYEVASLVHGADAWVPAAARTVGGPSGLDSDGVARLVSGRHLDANRAPAIALAAAVYVLVDENAALAKIILKAPLEHRGGKPAESLIDLARIGPAEWGRILAGAPAPGPDPARTIRGRLLELHPGIAFVGRVPRATKPAVMAGLDAAMPLFERNDRVFSADFERLDTSGMSRTEVAQARVGHATLRQVVLVFPGLRLGDVLDDRSQTLDGRAETLIRRVGFVHTAIERAGAERVLELDYGPRSSDVAKLKLDDVGAMPDEQRMVFATLKAFQRVHALTGHTDDAQALLARGLASASEVARLDRDTFAVSSGLDPARARAIHTRARALAGDAALTVGSVLDAWRDRFDHLAVGNVHADVQDYLRGLEGFEQLFGTLSFCRCEACQSILGPAAYFVDLMKFVDEEVRAQLTDRPDHPLDLRTRRPDLWTLELTCGNTNDRTPLLQIVVEILEGYVGRALDLDGASAVYGALAEADGSFGLPFHLPLTLAELCLAKQDTGRSDISEVLGALEETWTLAALSLTARDHALVTAPDLDLARLRQRYGIDFDEAESGLAPVDVQRFLGPMALSRDDFGELVATAFVAATGTVAIRAERRTTDSIQNDVENVHGLTAGALDRMHRLTRLRRHLPWSFAEFDSAFATLGATALDASVVRDVARLRHAELSLGVTFEELCGLAGPLPPALFERVFNAPAALALTDPLPQGGVRFVHPALREATEAPQVPHLARLLSALMLDVDQLERLVRMLAPRLGFDPADPDEAQRGFHLDVANLSLLYRYVRLSRAFGMRSTELIRLIAAGGVAEPLETLATLTAVLDLHADWVASGYTLDDVTVALGGTPAAPAHYPEPAEIARQILTETAEELTFDATVFAVTLGVSEDASRALVAANPALIVPAASRWRIGDGVDLADTEIVVPADVVGIADDVRRVLATYTTEALLARRLAGALAMAVDKVRALARFAGRSLAEPELAAALRDGGPAASIVDLAAALVPLVVAFRAPVWDADAIDHVRLHRTAYEIVDAPVFRFGGLCGLGTYARLAATAAPADLRAAIEAYPAITEELARALDVPRVLVVALHGHAGATAGAVAAIERLASAAKLAIRLGLDGDALAGLLATDYATLERSGEALWLPVPPKDRATAEATLLERRRDALAEHIVRTLAPDTFGRVSDLSSYFLIDVEAGGCQSTSRLIAATGSVQLYVQRVNMNLEQDRRPADDPDHVALRLSDGAKQQWSWRRSYRVWEANRKVFLWPENYLEPDLRDDKTSLFVDLERELLQTDVSEQNVLDAYGTYLAGFEQLASLTIAGAYHDVPPDGGRDVLHLFGVSNTDPPVYYYRTCEGLLAAGEMARSAAQWSAWRKVEVQISGRRIAPVIHEGRLHLFWTDIKTRSKSRIVDGSMEFSGYQHTMRVRLTTLRLDGTWTAPQELELPASSPFAPGRGIIQDPLDRLDNGRPRLDTRVHSEPVDDYTLAGPGWDWCWPEPMRVGGENVLFLRYRDFLAKGKVDLFERTMAPSSEVWPVPRPQVLCARATRLFHGAPIIWFWGRNSMANLVIEESRLDAIDRDQPMLKAFLEPGLWEVEIGTLRPGTKLLAIPGNVEDAIVQVGADVVVLQGTATRDDRYVVRRIGTTLARQVARRLFATGVDGLLDIETQKALREAEMPLTGTGGQILDRTNRGKLDFTGPYGTYYREIFFHVPLLLANHLAAQGRFAAAQRWYHFVFDPTAAEVIQGGNPLDRVWRFLELRHLDADALRDRLTDPEALERHRRDPFNPHAIARLRLSAYQKWVVRKYVENLLDWGDHLFTQFTMEAVNEALTLYRMAADLLGPRPADVGDCGTGGIEPRDYEHVGPLADGTDDLLIEMESWILGRWAADRRVEPVADSTRMARGALARAVSRVPWTSAEATGDGTFSAGWRDVSLTAWAPLLDGNVVARTPERTPHPPDGSHPGWDIVRVLGLVFCVPPNRTLLALWDRVEDRLYKIRHCLDITGERRELALLAPELDVGSLVGARADGLTPDDGLALSSGALPPYRFLFLIDRAKAFAAGLQGFGAALAVALEKKDAEALSRLRTVHQRNLTAFSTRLREWDVEIAEQGLETMRRQREAAEYRRDFFQGLLERDRSGWEWAETASRHVAAGLRGVEAVLMWHSAGLSLLPQVGSPFAMKYGGLEISAAAERSAGATGALAVIADAAASSASLEGNYDRRREGWANQRELAIKDLRVLEQQLKSAEVRVRAAQRTLELHGRSLDQTDEVLEIMDGRFSSLGLYTWLAQRLQRIYRDAYDNALALARLAQQAFRFERGDDAAPPLAPSYWEPGRAGLLAGERLLVDLQTLERRFVETNHRQHEVDQAFSVAQLDPAALITLRETGVCEIEIPEFHFDLYYPGHYRRRIKAVRLTIPCITGPFVNVSATLELLSSQIRTTADPSAPLVDVPLRRTTSIATSMAQNDAGVFELSFRDERYMPFEGAGAVSRWRVALPKTFRPFDYHSINDVILSISYTADTDGPLRQHVEQQNAAIEGTLLHHIANHPIARTFSLRQEFSSAFTRLLHSPVGTEVRLELHDRHFPVFAQGRTLIPDRAELLLRTPPGIAPGSFALSVDGSPVAAWQPDVALGGLLAAPMPAAFTAEIRPRTHSIVLSDPGPFGPSGSGDASPLDADKLQDVVLYLEYRLI